MPIEKPTWSKLQNIAATIVFVCFTLFIFFVDARNVHQELLHYQPCTADHQDVSNINSSQNLNPSHQNPCLLIKPISTIVRNVMSYLPLIYMVVTRDYNLYRYYASTMAITATSVITLKKVVHKTRPDNSNAESFPSGHAAMSFLGASLILYAYGALYGMPLMLISALNSSSRVYCVKHTPIDVIAGALLAIAITFYGPRCITYLLARLKKLINLTQP